MDVVHVFHQLFDILVAVRAADVMAGIQRETQPLDVVAQHNHRIGIFRESANLAADADADPFELSDMDQSAEGLHFFIERSPQFTGRNRQRHDFDRFGQAADGRELPIEFFACGLDLNAECHNVHAFRVAAGVHSRVEVGRDFGRLQVAAVLVNGDLDIGIFEIADLDQSLLQRTALIALR